MALGDHDPRWKDPQGSDNQNLFLWAQNLVKELRKGDYISNSIPSGITNAELADMADSTIKGRAVGAGSGDPQDLTATQATAILNAFVGDSGSGGTKGLVPAPITGDARKMLKGDGTWAYSGWSLLTSSTFPAAANLDIVLTSYTAFRAIKILIDSVIPATDDVDLYMRFSTDGGSNYDASGYSYANMGVRDSSATFLTYRSAAANQLIIGGDPNVGLSISNVAAEGGADLEITLWGRTSTSRWTAAHWHGAYYNSTGESHIIIGSGRRETAQDTDAVRFLLEGGGNFTSGNYAVYGLA